MKTYAKTYHSKKVGVSVQTDDTEGIEPLPQIVGFLASRKAFQLVGAPIVDGFGLEEDYEDGRCTGKGSLEPKYVTPGAECYNDSTDEWAYESQSFQ